MVILSTIVAAIGLLEDNVAVVIGAMVIAPLLGPNIALAFATSLGDSKLIWKALKTNLTGLGTALLLTIILGYIWPLNFESRELMMRTSVDIDGVVLALASGAAAVISITASWISSLVGVMVAVGMKKKNGKEVPNCVKKEETSWASRSKVEFSKPEVVEEEGISEEQIQEIAPAIAAALCHTTAPARC